MTFILSSNLQLPSTRPGMLVTPVIPAQEDKRMPGACWPTSMTELVISRIRSRRDLTKKTPDVRIWPPHRDTPSFTHPYICMQCVYVCYIIHMITYAYNDMKILMYWGKIKVKGKYRNQYS